MLPEYPKFKTLEFKDKELLSEQLKNSSSQICELNLANLLIWKDFDRPEYTFINGNLCILTNPLNEAPFFLEPLGKNKLLETTKTCLDRCGRISRASEEFVFRLPEERYSFTCIRSHFDYIYETKIMAELKGKRFDGKRNHIKRFKRHFPDYEFIALNPKHKKEALNLFEGWFKIRERSRFFPKLSHDSQKKALETAFNHFEELKLIGGAILIDKKLKGFMLGSAINKEAVSAHFQYFDPSLHGIAQVLTQESCRKTFSPFKYLNMEQDLGMPGLRTSKLSYHPLKLERKFEVKSAF